MDFLKVRAPYGLKDLGRAFWKRGAWVRIEDEGDGISGEENNRAYLSERTKIQMERSVVPGGCQLELVKWGYMEEAF